MEDFKANKIRTVSVQWKPSVLLREDDTIEKTTARSSRLYMHLNLNAYTLFIGNRIYVVVISFRKEILIFIGYNPYNK